MRRNTFALLSLVLVLAQLSGCVVYDRPYYEPHYYHSWWYR